MHARRFIARLAIAALLAVLARADAHADGGVALHPPNPTDPFDAILLREYQKLVDTDAQMKLTGQLLVIDNGDTEAFENGSVTVSRKQLRDYVARDAARAPLLIRLLLAHEIVHVLQFRIYGKVTSFPDTDDVLAYEAQADIMGAQALHASMAQEPRGPDITVAAMQMMFDLGSPEAGSDHPDPSARRNAVRFGFAFGQTIVAMLAARDERLSADQRKQFALSYADLRAKLDMDAQSKVDPWVWSLRQARRLVHWHAHALGLITKKTVTTSSSGDQFRYAIHVHNPRHQIVLLDLDVQSVAYARGVAHDGRQSLLDGSERYRIRIAPDGDYTIQGEMPRRTDAAWEPELIAIQDDRALWTLDYED